MPRITADILDELGVQRTGISLFEMDARFPGFVAGLPDWGPDYDNAPPVNQRSEAHGVLSNAILQAETTRSAMGAVAMNVGVPLPGAYTTLVDSLSNPIAHIIFEQMGDILKELAEQALEMAIEAVEAAMEGLDVMMNMVTSIPIYGYIIELVWKFAQAIVGIVKLVRDSKKADPVREYDWPVYNSGHDITTFNSVLSTLRDSYDWNWIWQPAHVEVDPVMEAYFGSTPLIGKARLLTGLIPTGSPGCVPGLAWVHQGIILTTGQYPRAYEVAETIVPSSRQQHAALWKSMTQNNDNPGLYCVDAYMLERQWAQYLEQMWIAIRRMGLSSDYRNRIQGLLGGPNGPFGTTGGATGLDLERDPTTSDIENMLPVRECRIVRERQWALADTTLIAYLDADMRAFQMDSTLKQHWRDRRVELLQHPARCGVILDDVEDPIYYQYLQESGVGTPQCQTVTDIAAAPGFKGGDNAPTGTPNMGPAIMGQPTRPRRGGGLGLALAAAAAFMVLRSK